MRRDDAAVLSISAALGTIVVAAIALSVFVIDRLPPPGKAKPEDSNSSLLVLTWAPTFCKFDQANPGCESGHIDKMGQTMMLHGLWPQPASEQFCGVPESVVRRVEDSDGGGLAAPDLPQGAQSQLQSMMSDSATAVPYEWYRHGTCSGVSPAEYFSHAVTLAEQAVKVLDPVFERASGGRLSLGAVRGRLNAEFGSGAGKRARLICVEVDREGIIAYQVQLSLPPVLNLEPAESPLSLGDALVKGPPLSTKCRAGHVP
ncbi:MAG: ribonuclease T(2) [Actinomycetia bacterium]|nr:ribonuclease T(2) [Actinomycetes bacterium]